MAKPLIDADALIAQFQTATAQQGEQLRKAVSGATLQALQGRELTLKNIRSRAQGRDRRREQRHGQERAAGGRRRRPARQGRGRHGRRTAEGRGSQPRGAGPAGGSKAPTCATST
jgi:hypothetical protein